MATTEVDHLRHSTGERLLAATTALDNFVASGSDILVVIETGLYREVYNTLLGSYGDSSERKRAASEVARTAILEGTPNVAAYMVENVTYVLKTDNGNDAAKSILSTALIDGSRETRVMSAGIINKLRNTHSNDTGFAGALKDVVDYALTNIKADLEINLQRV